MMRASLRSMRRAAWHELERLLDLCESSMRRANGRLPALELLAAALGAGVNWAYLSEVSSSKWTALDVAADRESDWPLMSMVGRYRRDATSALHRCVEEGRVPSDDETADMALLDFMMTAHRWQDIGRPNVRLDEELACAFMLTEPPRDTLDDKLPWPVFTIGLPHGLLATSDLAPKEIAPGSLQRLLVSVHHEALSEREISYMVRAGAADALRGDVASRISVRAIGDQESNLPLSIGTSLFNLADAVDPEHAPRHCNTETMLLNLAAAVFLHLQDQPPRRYGTRSSGVQKRPSGQLPQTTDYLLGQDITLSGTSLREAVTQHRAKREAPKVQWVVRGHIRNQACGPEMSERRMTWIRPYWKGPLDAPMLIRNHVLEEPESTQSTSTDGAEQ